MRTKLLTAFLVTAICGLGLASGAAAATTVQQAASQNWSGYVASTSSGKQFSSVSGSWVQPTANCTSGTGYAAFWVGLGGSGQTQALEQAGTEADCTSSGQATYFAWYELVPAAPVRLGLTINPGDHISTRVSVSGTTVTIALSDATSGQSVSKTLTMSNPDASSAEWVAEAPSSCDGSASSCSPLPLTDFGAVKFSNATATTSDGHTGPISDSSWRATQVALQSGLGGYAGGPQFSSDTSGSAGATPSSLSADGESFSVAWSDGGASSSTGVGASSGSGYGGGDGYPGYGYSGGGYGYSDGSGSDYGYGGGYGYSAGSGDYGGYPGGYAYSY